jgi:hypothetical protein
MSGGLGLELLTDQLHRLRAPFKRVKFFTAYALNSGAKCRRASAASYKLHVRPAA